jgi:hypothetical protein
MQRLYEHVLGIQLSWILWLEHNLIYSNCRCEQFYSPTRPVRIYALASSYSEIDRARRSGCDLVLWTCNTASNSRIPLLISPTAT